MGCDCGDGNSDCDSREVGTAEDDASEVRFEERGESVDRTEDIEECKEEKSSVAGLLDKLKAHPRRLAAIAGGIVLVIAVAVVV